MTEYNNWARRNDGMWNLTYNNYQQLSYKRSYVDPHEVDNN